MNPNFTQLLTEIIALIVASGGLTAVFGIGRKKKNKELIENTLNVIDEKQNTRLDDIDKKLDEVSSFLKDSHFLKKLNADTQTAMNRILDIKEFDNSEITQALFLGREKLVKFAEHILFQNFDIDNRTIHSTAYHLLKDISGRVIIANLNLENPIDFLTKLQKFLLIQIENFIYGFQDYKKKQNGHRRDEFRKSLLEMFEIIVKTTIDDYNLTLENEKSRIT